MDNMQTLYGFAPLSDFRRRQLRERLQAACPSLCDLQVAAAYFLDVRGTLDDAERARLSSLLSLDRAADAPADTPAPGVSIYVIPRTGTVSPWSSKATDIFHVCGLERVRRVERGFRYRIETRREPSAAERAACARLLHDRMTEEASCSPAPAQRLFAERDGRPLREVELAGDAREKLQSVNRDWGLALSDDDIEYLLAHYSKRRRAPTDAELMTFAQANSEHCRHKLFNAAWTLDGRRQPRTPFEMIRHTHACSPHGVLSAYEDNAAVVAGARARRLVVDAKTRRYRCSEEAQPFLIKVETHNHPTAIAPFAGAATGAGGEIRDEAATGRGGRPAAGLTGFSTSNLRIPGFTQPWEGAASRPSRIASPLQIMTEGPVGGARFNNEFGRPNLCGYFRTFERQEHGWSWGYHKPIMVAGGIGSLREADVAKRAFPAGTPLVVFGGPAMLIGLGGGSASSVGGGASAEELDFVSVQRDNAEIQRRCQEVVEQCAARGAANPLLAIHDVGAGGLANALPELVHGAGLGGCFELRDVPCADGGLSPMEIWCNEAQERYVAAVAAERLDEFIGFCRRERCPVAVVGQATAARDLVVKDSLLGRDAVRLPMSVLLGDPPRPSRSVATPSGAATADVRAAATDDIRLDEAVERVLKMPAVASKSFLITIGDRSVTGLVARDQMVGPWQVPVADAALTLADYSGYAGQAMAVGERAPVAVADAPASGRLAVSEALLNVLSADVGALGDVRLSANWMAAAGDDAQAAALFETVRAVAEELCPALGIAIPVGKDSLSMQMTWRDNGRARRVVSPLSLVASAFAPVADVRNALTPQPDPRTPAAGLWLLDLSGGKNRLGGSCLMQAYGRAGGAPADLDDAQKMINLFGLLRELRARGWLLAYHDRSDGGLFACLAEMAFAGRCGVRCEYRGADRELLAFLFSEEPGVVIQASPQATSLLPALARRHGLDGDCRHLGHCTTEQQLVIDGRGSRSWPVMLLKRWWWETSYRIQALRDHPLYAAQERDKVCDQHDPGLSASLTFDPAEEAAPPVRARADKAPKVAILREQGVNGHMEMAAAFLRAGFDACDVHMSDLIEGREDLRTFHGLAAAGGFSYGDVLGAGAGWAQSILLHRRVRDVFAAFFARDDTFSLGVCNGCQMLSRLAGMIPGAAHWPRFEGNGSEQFEARLVMVRVLPSASILLDGMEGSVLPVVVAHGEGRTAFASTGALRQAQPYACLQYVDAAGRATERYPENPNASAQGHTGFCSEDGRVTIMMPHPERVFRSCQHSWHPPEWGEAGPWLRLFQNARRWLAT